MSVIDVNSIVSQLMAVERQPLQKFDVKNIGIQARISAYGGIKSALSTFQTAAQAFANADSFNVSTASSSSSDFVGISASKTAAINNFSVEVSQLAQNQKLASSSFSALTSPVGEGTITLDFGKYTTDSGSTTFTSNPDKTSATITIDSNNNTLAGVRDAINNAKAGVSASIVNDGSGYKLTIVSTDTGESNALRITTNDTGDANNTDAAGLSALAYNASTVGNVTNMTEKQAAQNAKLRIDGIDISKPTNVVSDAVEGVTLTLNKVTTAAVSMSVAKNTGSIKSSVQAFVKAYNTLSQTLTDATAYNKDTKQGALLNGDPTIRSIQYSLRNALIQNIEGTGGDIRSMTQVGLKINEKGVMSLDSSKFDAAVASDPQAVVGLFASNARASDSMIRIDSFDKSSNSTANMGISVINKATQATYTSSALAFSAGAFTVDSSNKTFAISVNGTAASVTLTEGSYTQAQLAAELQTRINSNTSLQAVGAKVGVTIGSDNKIILNNAKYGSEGSLSITSDLLGTGTSGALTGIDVKVRMGNEIKTGVGQQVTMPDGLKFSVLGGAESDPDGADRGSINVSNGIGARLDSLLSKMLSSTGVIATRIDSMNTQAKSITKQTDDFNRRLVDMEKRLRTQYTALDVSVSQMQNTSTWLTTQLANLPKIS
jgi:flagellar hook-associated protein 2